MKANTDKSHFIMSCAESKTCAITYAKAIIYAKKANLLATFMNVTKKLITMMSFIESQFGYCPLIWMFRSRGLNKKINRIHDRPLRIPYNNK